MSSPSASSSAAASPSLTPAQPGSPPLAVVLAASAVSGGLEPLLTFPLEYIKTAQQLKTHIRPSSKAPLKVSNIDASIRSVVESIEQGARETPRSGAGAAGASTVAGGVTTEHVRPPRRVSIAAVARDAWGHQGSGLRGLYRGVDVVAAGGIAKAIVRMGSYDRLKRALQAPDGSISGGRSLIAGFGAGLAEAVLVVIPTETVKTKIVHATTLPADHKFYRAATTSSLTALRSIYSIGGPRAIYAGATATLARQVCSASARFGTYSSLKNLVGGSMRPGQKLPSGITFGLGAIAGGVTVCEWIVLSSGARHAVRHHYLLWEEMPFSSCQIAIVSTMPFECVALRSVMTVSNAFLGLADDILFPPSSALQRPACNPSAHELGTGIHCGA